MSVIYTTTLVKDKEFDYAYSDEGRYLISADGAIYDTAIDVLGSGKKYTEGELIEELIEATE